MCIVKLHEYIFTNLILIDNILILITYTNTLLQKTIINITENKVQKKNSNKKQW